MIKDDQEIVANAIRQLGEASAELAHSMTLNDDFKNARFARLEKAEQLLNLVLKDLNKIG